MGLDQAQLHLLRSSPSPAGILGPTLPHPPQHLGGYLCSQTQAFSFQKACAGAKRVDVFALRQRPLGRKCPWREVMLCHVFLWGKQKIQASLPLLIKRQQPVSSARTSSSLSHARTHTHVHLGLSAVLVERNLIIFL